MSVYRHGSALRVGLVLAAVLILGAVPAMAQSPEPQTSETTSVVPAGVDPIGISYADLGAAWWRWLLNVPPVEDPETADCQAGQGGEVFFIPHVPPGFSESINCAVEADQWILASAGGTIWDNSDRCCSEEGVLAANVEADRAIFSRPAISIDGEAVADIENYWVQHPLFLIDYAEDNPIGLTPGTWRAAMGGWFVMIPPLEPGEHTIVVRDAIDIPDDDAGPLDAELTAEVVVAEAATIEQPE